MNYNQEDMRDGLEKDHDSKALVNAYCEFILTIDIKDLGSV